MAATHTAVIPYESLDPLTIGASGDDDKVSRDTLELEIPAANLVAAIYPDEPAPVDDATEAARAALQVGFERLGFEEIVAFTAFGNHRSAAVMERLGMREDLDGAFDHPAVPEGHALRRHRLYRIARPKQG